MSPEEKLIELLEKEGNQEAQIELRKLISENPELKDDKELYQQIILALRKKGENELRSEIDGYLDDYLENNKVRKLFSNRNYLLFAGIAASLSLAILFFNRTQNNSPVKIPIEWNINGIPEHADSATFETDSLKNKQDSLKDNKK